jgi:hypothetical protein
VTVYVPVIELQRVGLADINGQPTFNRGSRLIVNQDVYEVRDIEDNQTVFDNSALFIVIYGMRGVS